MYIWKEVYVWFWRLKRAFLFQISLLRHKNSIAFFRSMTIYLDTGEIVFLQKRKNNSSEISGVIGTEVSKVWIGCFDYEPLWNQGSAEQELFMRAEIREYFWKLLNVYSSNRTRWNRWHLAGEILCFVSLIAGWMCLSKLAAQQWHQLKAVGDSGIVTFSSN